MHINASLTHKYQARKKVAKVGFFAALGDGKLNVELGRASEQLPEEAPVDAVGAVRRFDPRERRNVESEKLGRTEHRKKYLQVGRKVRRSLFWRRRFCSKDVCPNDVFYIYKDSDCI